MSSWTGTAERAVLLPHVTDLWTDHIYSALRRAIVLTPSIRRTLHDETMHPIVEVEPPRPAFDPARDMPADVAF